ncbi:uncharacterized protein CLUP02_16937 [Colletotrichum lupini]|uniref:Uncharacterized protein n=1 Tax=Colletotrichum lupini TaxID=145971 RepID=A0A9Q8WQG3_9PEZI|nr:uncharacterized protein CLUP02_16937 [Colletotrichum lupini]UQC91402.1 hypothetical protein CLUP02_16937 [Colletotrichum lupini]
MRFSIVTLLTAIMAVTTAASSVEAEKRQLSAVGCVQQCMDDLGIYDGHAISQCRRTCEYLKTSLSIRQLRCSVAYSFPSYSTESARLPGVAQSSGSIIMRSNQSNNLFILSRSLAAIDRALKVISLLHELHGELQRKFVFSRKRGMHQSAYAMHVAIFSKPHVLNKPNYMYLHGWFPDQHGLSIGPSFNTLGIVARKSRPSKTRFVESLTF